MDRKALFTYEVVTLLDYMCQTQARGPNLARHVIIVGPRDNIERALELARRVYCAVNAAGPTTNSKHNIPYQQSKMQVNLQLITVSYIRKRSLAKPCKLNML